MSEHTDDPFGGRAPTSHERMTGRPWDDSYRDGPAGWQIGMPQPAVVRLGEAGAFSGAVLDAGCGSGENTVHIASLGPPVRTVLGVDVAETALEMARRTAADRSVEADFAIADALDLGRLGGSFDTVLDCGLFHTFDAEERPRYVAGLAAITRPGGVLRLLCLSDTGPGVPGPHPVSRAEIASAFGDGWSIESIEPGRLRTRFHDQNGGPAWVAAIRRV